MRQSQRKKIDIAATNQKIDYFFKPMARVKRHLENDENSQEKGRTSPSPPSSQSKLHLTTKTFVNENNINEINPRTFGGENNPNSLSNENTVKTFGGLKSFDERENTALNQFEDRENIGCKISRPISPGTLTKRQPLKEKSIKPLNTYKITTTSKPTSSTFSVLRDSQDLHTFNVYRDSDELNTQFIEEGDSLDSGYTIVPCSLIDPDQLYKDIDRPKEKFKVYIDDDVKIKKPTDTQQSSPLLINYSDSEDELPKVLDQFTSEENEPTPEFPKLNQATSFPGFFSDDEDDTGSKSFTGFFSDDEENDIGAEVFFDDDIQKERSVESVDDFSVAVQDTTENNQQKTFFDDD